VIVSVNSVKTVGVEQFRKQVAEFAPGSSISVVIVRDGEQMTKRVTLTTFPTSEQQGSALEEDKPSAWLGITVRSLTSDERADAKVSGGVLVEDVESGSAADDAGIEAGDIILEVGRTRINGIDDYSRAVRRFKGTSNAVLFRINRGGSVLYVAIEPGE
jgi:serine protease Do